MAIKQFLISTTGTAATSSFPNFGGREIYHPETNLNFSDEYSYEEIRDKGDVRDNIGLGYITATFDGIAITNTASFDNAMSDFDRAQVIANTVSASNNSASIATNINNISTNSASIAVNINDISTNSASIAVNINDISTNSASIATNTENIAINSASIAALSSSTSKQNWSWGVGDDGNINGTRDLNREGGASTFVTPFRAAYTGVINAIEVQSSVGVNKSYEIHVLVNNTVQYTASIAASDGYVETGTLLSVTPNDKVRIQYVKTTDNISDIGVIIHGRES